MIEKNKRGKPWRPSSADIGIGVILLLGTILLLFAKLWEKELDEQTLCPLNGEYARTVVLVDATDSFSEEQTNAVDEKINALWRRELDLHEWIGIYIVHEDDLVLPRPVIALCNPGNENTANPIFENPDMMQEHFEENFKAPIATEIAKLANLPEQSTSPIMEMIMAVALDPNFDSSQKRRLVIISDLLQNVEEYSQYGAPTQDGDYEEWRGSDYAAEVAPSDLLQDVDVSVLYVKRQNTGAWQNRDHVEFWERYFEDLGGSMGKVEDLGGSVRKAPSAIKKTPQKKKPAAAPQPKPKPAAPQGASNRSVAPAVQDPAVNDTQAEDVSAPKNVLAPNQARVVEATPVDKPIYREKETCKTVYKKSSSSSQNNIANAAAGVASGGLIGGGGQQQQQQQPARTSEYVCSTQRTRVNTIKGYEITYEYNGRTFKQWMEKHPGDVVEVDASGKALPPQ